MLCKIVIEKQTKAWVIYLKTLIYLTLFLSFGGCATVQTNEIKDEISNLSFSHDGKKLLFDRCRAGNCQIQVYDRGSGELGAYQSPPNEQWTMARSSYDGKKIVFSAIPMGEKYLDMEQMQIAIMDADGRNLKKLTSSPLPKIYPTFSHSGKKVLYVKAGRIRKQGRSPASDYDAWEVDVDTGRETRLTKFEYFFMRGVCYFPDDERFLYYADGPFAFPGVNLPKDVNAALARIGEEARKRNVYLVGILTMKRGDLFPEHPYTFGEKIHPIQVLLSNDGTRLFFEDHVGKFYLYSPDGNHRLIAPSASVDSAAISPDGEYLAEIAAGVGIHIYRVQDGVKMERIYVPTPRSEGFDYNRLPKFKLLSEQPSRIINR